MGQESAEFFPLTLLYSALDVRRRRGLAADSHDVCGAWWGGGLKAG